MKEQKVFAYLRTKFLFDSVDVPHSRFLKGFFGSGFKIWHENLSRHDGITILKSQCHNLLVHSRVHTTIL